LDGAPLLDIKPYTRRFDNIATARNGWQGEIEEETAKKRGKLDYTGESEKPTG